MFLLMLNTKLTRPLPTISFGLHSPSSYIYIDITIVCKEWIKFEFNIIINMEFTTTYLLLINMDVYEPLKWRKFKEKSIGTLSAKMCDILRFRILRWVYLVKSHNTRGIYKKLHAMVTLSWKTRDRFVEWIWDAIVVEI